MIETEKKKIKEWKKSKKEWNRTKLVGPG